MKNSSVQPIRSIEKIEEMKMVLKRSNYRDYFMFVFGINTGFRISDILKLKVKDITDFDYIRTKEKKTKNTRRIQFNPSLLVLIEEYTKGLDREKYLFENPVTNEPISRIQAYRILKSASIKVGIEEVGTHTMRKTFGWHHYNRYKDVALLQMIFNHKSPDITLRYIGISQEQIDESIMGMSL